jgi:hypothetical protein
LSPIDDRHDTEVEEANSRLADGLKTCRSIVRDYRAIITGDQDGEQSRADTARDQGNKV